jgi:hypothetical protein
VSSGDQRSQHGLLFGVEQRGPQRVGRNSKCVADPADLVAELKTIDRLMRYAVEGNRPGRSQIRYARTKRLTLAQKAKPAVRLLKGIVSWFFEYRLRLADCGQYKSIPEGSDC